jgi:hypothetical protein
MGYDETSCVAETRPYQSYTDRLEKALGEIDKKTKSFQILLEQCEKTPSAQTEFENRLRILVEKAEDLSSKIKF